MTDQKILLTTTTGELFLPTRIIYHVHDREELLRKFRRLRCMEFDGAKRRWTWNHEYEAKELGFPTAYDAIPPDGRPLILASCYEVDGNRLHVYVRSALRLTKFLVFFNKHISPRRQKSVGFGVSERLRQPPAPETVRRTESRREAPRCG